MSIAARKPLVPAGAVAGLFAAHTWRQRPWPIVRQVGEIGHRHGLCRTAAVGTDRPCGERYGKYDADENLQHCYLLLCSIVRKLGAARRSLIGFQSTRAYKVPAQGATRGTRSEAQFYFTQIVATAFALWLAFAHNPASAEPEIGKTAPALVLTTLDGATFNLADLRGKVVLINYWATWCAPCRKEMPKLDAFYRRYHARGLDIMAISIDFPRDLEKARKMARTFAYPAASAQAITDNGFAKQKAVPFTWIVDADGKIRDMMIEVRDELLDGIVVPLLPR